jgi:ribosomal protein L37AE/L43A
MPGIFEVRCDTCDYRVGGSSYMVVVMPDGSEEICPHPGEIEHAEFVTREKWSSLVRQSRIRYRHAMFCKECGAIDYYGPDYSEKPQSLREHIRNLVLAPSSDKIQQFQCKSCGEKELSPLVWKEDISISQAEGEVILKQIVIRCPKCKMGTLTSGMVAIS